MEDNQAIHILQAVEAATGWKILSVTRQDVASRWYPDAEDPVMTDEQWSAIQGVYSFRKLHENEGIWDIIWEIVDEAIDEAEGDLLDNGEPGANLTLLQSIMEGKS